MGGKAVAPGKGAFRAYPHCVLWSSGEPLILEILLERREADQCASETRPRYPSARQGWRGTADAVGSAVHRELQAGRAQVSPHIGVVRGRGGPHALQTHSLPPDCHHRRGSHSAGRHLCAFPSPLNMSSAFSEGADRCEEAREAGRLLNGEASEREPSWVAFSLKLREVVRESVL